MGKRDLSQLIPEQRVGPGLASMLFQHFVVLRLRTCHPGISVHVILGLVVLGLSQYDVFI